MTGKLFVDSFNVSGMRVDQTDLNLIVSPTKFDLDINGGFTLPNGGPQAVVDGRLLAQVGATDPIRLDLTATAANWTVQPGTSFSNFVLSVNGGLASLSSPPNLTVAVNASGAVLGTNVNFGGAVVLATGELRYLGLQVNPSTMVVGGTTISGIGCPTRLTAPASVPVTALPPTDDLGRVRPVHLRQAGRGRRGGGNPPQRTAHVGRHPGERQRQHRRHGPGLHGLAQPAELREHHDRRAPVLR